MRTSTIATSGGAVRTSRISSSASPERPTTSCPASSRRDAMPSRRSALSSATTMRSGRSVVTIPILVAETVQAAYTETMGVGGTGARSAAEGDVQRVEHAVARILAENDRPVEVYAAVLEAIGSSPGWELASGEPVWIVDAPEDGNFPRANVARRDGLHAAFGFPLLSPKGVVGVMEFFSRQHREPDERLLATMRELGSQIGQFVARRHAEEAVRGQ